MAFARRHFLAAVAALGLAAAALMPGVGAAPAIAAEASALDSNAMAALNAWWGALVAGTPAAIGAVLAPEFQIMRADGSGYDRAGYLGSSLPKVAAIPEFSKMTVTGNGDNLVVRYYVTVTETRDGKTVQRHAPRLTAFRKDSGNWLVVAHANFATLEN
jgi:type II secretory pathway pseudopilin PulG